MRHRGTVAALALIAYLLAPKQAAAQDRADAAAESSSP
jgi:hypothetical protein